MLSHELKKVTLGCIVVSKPLASNKMYQKLNYQKHCKDSDYINKSDDSDEGGDVNMTPKPSKAVFIVYWTTLIILLKKYLF